MVIIFYAFAAVAVLATALAVTRRNAVHALLYLIVSFLAVALIFDQLGAPFIAALEVIIYAGAIMVLFVFVVMMLNLGEGRSAEESSGWLHPRAWLGPAILAAILLGEQAYLFKTVPASAMSGIDISAKQVGIALFGPYVAGVELASVLLMSGLVGAYHLGRRSAAQEEEMNDYSTSRTRASVSGGPVHVGTDRTSHAA